MSTATASSGTRSIGAYFFIIEGLPKKYTWQDLKDLLRSCNASHGVWTDMAIYGNGTTGGKGLARVQRVDEARNLYTYLTSNAIEGRRLRVHLWDITGDARLVRCNCEDIMKHSEQGYPAQAVEVNRMARTSGWQVIPPAAAAQVPYTAAPAVQYAPIPGPQSTSAADPASQAALIQQMQNLQLSPQDPRYAAYYRQYQQYQQSLRAQQQAAAQQTASRPMYAVSSNGIPKNTSQGIVRTECRGIFVSGLSYKAQPKEVRSLFARAGQITKCEVQKDGSTGKPKGHATVQYATAREAQQAIDMLNGKTYMNMALKVRPDKEATAISPPPSAQASRPAEPIIVNGSQVGARV